MTRSSMACTTCRQVKLRCDAPKRFPQPCSRCERLGKNCVSDPTFKRRAVRGALEKVLKEKEQLQRLVQSYRNEGQEPQGSIAAPVHHGKSVSPNGSQDADSYDLYGVDLGKQTVSELFEHFSNHYFSHLPILPIGKPVKWVYDNSKLLFWTITYTSAHHHAAHQQYSALLLTSFKRLLSEHLVESIQNVYTIQALLILSLWPLEVRYQRDDPSWNYCSLAVSAAMQMGLDDTKPQPRPGIAEPSEEAKLLGLKTWLGCFWISTSLSSEFALAPPMASVAHLEPLVRQRVQSSLPLDFIAHLEIERYSMRASAVLTEASTGLMRRSLVDVLERDLESVAHRMPVPPSLHVQIDLLAAKLRLCAFQLICGEAATIVSTGPDNSLTRAAWYRGFEVATNLAALLAASTQQIKSSQNLDSCPASTTMTVFYPKHYFRVNVMAAMYLLKLQAVDRAMTPGDKAFAREHVRQISQSFWKRSTAEMDESARAARMIEELGRYVEDQRVMCQLHTSKPDGGKVVPVDVVADGMSTVGEIRRMNTPNSSSSHPTPPQPYVADPPALSVLSSAEPPEAQDHEGEMWQQYPWDDFSSSWNAWPTDVDEILQMLGTDTGGMPMAPEP